MGAREEEAIKELMRDFADKAAAAVEAQREASAQLDGALARLSPEEQRHLHTEYIRNEINHEYSMNEWLRNERPWPPPDGQV